MFVSYTTDLRNTDLKSETFIRKLQRAQEALSQSDSGSAKTLSASFGPKWPYKRTMSAPASIAPRQDTKEGTFQTANRWLPSLFVGCLLCHFPKNRQSKFVNGLQFKNYKLFKIPVVKHCTQVIKNVLQNMKVLGTKKPLILLLVTSISFYM